MIHKEECFCATCDNCGEIFEDGEYSLFPLESDVKESMQNHGEWYCGDTDKDHLGKHYCFDCFKWHPEIDDKIILDTTRTKQTIPAIPVASGYTIEQVAEAIKAFVYNQHYTIQFDSIDEQHKYNESFRGLKNILNQIESSIKPVAEGWVSEDVEYTDDFIKWRDRFFEYAPVVYEWKSLSKGTLYTTKGLEETFKKAMLESPIKTGLSK